MSKPEFKSRLSNYYTKSKDPPNNDVIQMWPFLQHILTTMVTSLIPKYNKILWPLLSFSFHICFALLSKNMLLKYTSLSTAPVRLNVIHSSSLIYGKTHKNVLDTLGRNSFHHITSIINLHCIIMIKTRDKTKVTHHTEGFFFLGPKTEYYNI